MSVYVFLRTPRLKVLRVIFCVNIFFSLKLSTGHIFDVATQAML